MAWQRSETGFVSIGIVPFHATSISNAAVQRFRRRVSEESSIRLQVRLKTSDLREFERDPHLGGNPYPEGGVEKDLAPAHTPLKVGQ